MALIDERGRLFGRINLIDAMVGLFALVLIPLGYGAYVLFRQPVPTITSITPAQIVAKQPVRLEIVGTNLRPLMKAHLASFEAQFLLQSTTRAEVRVPDPLPPGVYDLILSDEAQELVRKPGALSIVAPVAPPVVAQLQLLGDFVGLSPEVARRVRVGAAVSGGSADAPAEVLAIRSMQPGVRSVTVGTDTTLLAPVPDQMRVPAIVRVTCVIVDSRCTFAGMAAAPDVTVSLPVRTSADQAAAVEHLSFRVSAVRPADAPAAFGTASLRVRFVARPEVAQSFKAGDSDLAAAGALTGAERASLTSLEADRQSLTATANVTVASGQTYQVPQQVVSFNGTVRVPVVSTSSGWQYKNKAVKIGAPFSFETETGFAQGWIAEMTVVPLPAASPR